jgi:hypothetical protein
MACQPLLCGRLLKYAGVRVGVPGQGLVPGPGQIRWRRINIQKPHRPSFFRQKLLAVSKPAWEEDERLEDLPNNCTWSEKVAEAKEWNMHLNQLEKFDVDELRQDMENSQMIAFFHSNPMRPNNFRKAWQNGRRFGMELKQFNIRVGRNCLEGTKWENCLHFWFNFPGDYNQQPILFSPEVQPRQLLAFEKKVPEFNLLGCVVHGRILSRAQVGLLVNMPDLQTQRQELVGILGRAQKNTSDLLGASQRNLSTNLEQFIKDQTS